MTDWLVGPLIYKFSHHNIDVMAAFRFRLYYVNPLISHLF